VGHYERRPLAGHLRGLGGGQGEVVFGDVEEFGLVFCAVRVGDGGSGSLVAVEALVSTSPHTSGDKLEVTRPAAPPSSAALLSPPSAA
jgi:hypothetical protein